MNEGGRVQVEVMLLEGIFLCVQGTDTKVAGIQGGCIRKYHRAMYCNVCNGIFLEGMPGKKDEVSFVVTRIDEDRNVAVGLISRIIKQNI